MTFKNIGQINIINLITQNYLICCYLLLLLCAVVIIIIIVNWCYLCCYCKIKLLSEVSPITFGLQKTNLINNL